MQQRRRGEELEDTILRAAWAELREVGYAGLTMEGVAARARTGKQVLYRRWHNRAELVIAAMRHNLGSIADRVPDTGELRGDVLAVLRHMVKRQHEIGPDVLHGLMAEAYDLEPELLGIMTGIMTGVMTAILERAAERGEIPAADLSERVATVPVDLLRHELLLSRRPVSSKTAREIVDEVFLPLVRAKTVAG